MLTGRVTGTVARIVAAEGVPQPFASATVSFSARTREFPADTDLVIPDRVTCRLDAQGRILDPTDTEGVRLGVELAASENIEGGFSTEVRIAGTSFTTRVFDIIVRAGETIDIATAVHVPAQPGQVVDKLAGLVDRVQEWVDDPMTLPDVGPAVEAAAGSASAAAESAQQAHESAVAAAGSAGDAHSDRVAAEVAAQAAAGSASTATTAAAHVDEVATTVDERAGDAEQAATQAAGARDTAVGAASSASTSASTATTQAQAAAGDRLAAQEARTGAETAQGKAETAQQGAEDARDAAHGSALDASGSASDAQEAVNAVPAAVTSALSTWFLRGNGSPVGVVLPSSAGVQYVDLAATNGARVWISTGTTTSAWKVVDGDTGWRDIALDPTYGVEAAGGFFWGVNGQPVINKLVRIRRVGTKCMFSSDGPLQPKQDFSTSTNSIILCPPGFQGSYQTMIVLSRYGNNGSDPGQHLVQFAIPGPPSQPVKVRPVMDRNWDGLATGTAWPRQYGGVWMGGEWNVDPYIQWPTTLPGTPA